MRVNNLGLLLTPLLLFGIACEENPALAPDDALFAKNTGSSKANYDAFVLEGGNGAAYDINDRGIAVGSAREMGMETYPALRWAITSEGASTPEDLGPLPEPFHDAFAHNPVAINSDGVIVGWFNWNNWWGAFFHTDATGMRPLPRFTGDTYEYRASDVNDAGIIVGLIDFAVRDDDGTTIIDRLRRAAVWPKTRDEPILLPPLPDHDKSSATAQNQRKATRLMHLRACHLLSTRLALLRVQPPEARAS